MWFRKKKAERSEAEEVVDAKPYNDVLSDRLSAIGNYTHDYDESERDAVEARLRRMFYGAKVEGSLTERAEAAQNDDDEPESDAFGRISSF